MKEDKFRVRNMALLLYPSDPTHQKAMETIKSSYDYIAILHDKDTDWKDADYILKDGEVFTGNILDSDVGSPVKREIIKKAHWHVILRFKNGCWNSAIAKDLGIEINYTEQIRNFNNAILYLIHYNDSDKFQYSKEEVFGTFKNRLIELINTQDKNEGEKIVELIEYIEQQEKYIYVTDFAKYCASNGYWSEFRRSGAIFLRMIEERNFKIINNENVQSSQ